MSAVLGKPVGQRGPKISLESNAFPVISKHFALLEIIRQMSYTRAKTYSLNAYMTDDEAAVEKRSISE